MAEFVVKALGRKTVWLSALVLGLSSPSCLDGLSPGRWGVFRIMGIAQEQNADARHANPYLPLMPPVSDRAGNIYTAYGELDLPNTVNVFITQAIGGERLCISVNNSLIKSMARDYGVHGWVGFAQDQAWLWSGYQLVQVSGRTGNCNKVIDKDVTTRLSDLYFSAIIPWVRDAPSQTTLVAFVQTDNDQLPFQVLIDLRSSIYTSSHAFETSPAYPNSVVDPYSVKVLGTGADPDNNIGFVLVNYTTNNKVTSHVEARFIDFDANTIASPSVHNAEAIAQYGIQGYLQADDKGDVAGLTQETPPRLVVFNRSGGTVLPISSMIPVGVHRWHNSLWLVGKSKTGNHPVIAPIHAGVVGEPQVWASSEAAAAGLQTTLTLTDDRANPKRLATWYPNTDHPRTAMGDFPFLSAHSLNEYTTDTTLWLVAGPLFGRGVGVVQYFIAVAPVGIAYP